ncbi:MAG: 4-hydroxythreonine-4-phosphate dehydrogenase PdxA [Halioglobus sp.]
MTVARIAITAGEPAGIGPDVTLAAAMNDWDAELVAIADRALLQARARQLSLDIECVNFDPSQRPNAHRAGKLPVLDVPLAEPATPGKLNPANGPYVLETLSTAIERCSAGTFDAMVTGPVQKSVINDAGIAFSGHTEFLAAATGTDRVVMMLATETLRVALVTTHLPLRQVPAAITAQTLRETLKILHDALRQQFGIDIPRIAVLGLNPHAGESGHMGREEIDTIIPVLEECRAAGMQLEGPLPADTAFSADRMAGSDAFLAMYHDQGLPVLKFAGFGRAINITLGLPLIRTSVDHGTALDLAGSGRADAGSMQHALQAACRLATSSKGDN